MSRYEQRLNSGIPLFEAASALQKSIRRGQEEVAFWWAREICESGYHAYCWKRLSVVASEDIGNADPMSAVVVSGLWTTWRAIWDQQGKKSMPSWDILAQAVLALCRAPKSREADELVCYIDELETTGWKPVVPAYALDAHTGRGREKLKEAGVGRDDPRYWRSWWEEGTLLYPVQGDTISRYHGRLEAYGRGDDEVDEHVHHVEVRHRCVVCLCWGDVSCDVCSENLCPGHVVACSRGCGTYFCHDDAPALNVCAGCVNEPD